MYLLVSEVISITLQHKVLKVQEGPGHPGPVGAQVQLDVQTHGVPGGPGNQRQLLVLRELLRRNLEDQL